MDEAKNSVIKQITNMPKFVEAWFGIKLICT